MWNPVHLGQGNKKDQKLKAHRCNLSFISIFSPLNASLLLQPRPFRISGGGVMFLGNLPHVLRRWQQPHQSFYKAARYQENLDRKMPVSGCFKEMRSWFWFWLCWQIHIPAAKSPANGVNERPNAKKQNRSERFWCVWCQSPAQWLEETQECVHAFK